jgi:NADPH:quinone reductase-like Zn-dependent oxidoreductase
MPRVPSLVLLTDRHATGGRDLIDVVAAALDAGLPAVQLREKDLLAIPWFHPVQLMNANKAVIGVNLGHLWDRIDMLRREMLALLADAEAGRITPVVGKTFPLTDAAGAHRYIQERQNVGKVVLTA